MEETPYLIHALSPLHPGTGQAVGVIDLPIARLRATGMPFLPGSSVKGVLRDTRAATLDRNSLLAVFGPETNDAGKFAGALVVGDATLLALPVRSFVGTFAWVTSPLLLNRARRDLGPVAAKLPALPELDARSARVAPNNRNLHEGMLYLEDLDLPASESADVDAWARWLAPLVSPDADQMVVRRFVVVDDETMTFLWETATQVDARIRLDPSTRTVARGALWYEESLPAETVLLGLLGATRSWSASAEMDAASVLSRGLPSEEVLQFGGKATIGRGRCRILPLRKSREERT